MRGVPRSAPVRRASLAQLRSLVALPAALEAVLADLVSISAIVAANAGRSPDLDRCGLRAEELRARALRWRDAIAALQQPATHTDRLAGAPNADVGPDDEPAAAEEYAAPAITWAEIGAQQITLRRTPLSVAGPFERHRAGPPRAWVFVSATLSVGDDFGHFVEALGLRDARCERWDSPFDFARQAALWVPRGVGDPGAPGHAARVVDAVWPLIRANRGRAFVLCTTLRAVREAADRLVSLAASDDERLGVLVQGDASRAALLTRFREPGASVLIGSASFWEGVDVAGDALSLVVIDKLPFAPPDDPVVKARSDALRRAGRDPFAALHLPAAALALKQGAGRLIRTEDDRGVLVVGDERLLTRGYGRLLIRGLPPFARVERVEDALGYLPAVPALSARPATNSDRPD
jgi:ATP-dependent DNA helicase DinG